MSRDLRRALYTLESADSGKSSSAEPEGCAIRIKRNKYCNLPPGGYYKPTPYQLILVRLCASKYKMCKHKADEISN